VLPSAEAYEPRWVADTTVLQVSPGPRTGISALADTRSLLADIRDRLDALPSAAPATRSP
jgi:hypothetical protein